MAVKMIRIVHLCTNESFPGFIDKAYCDLGRALSFLKSGSTNAWIEDLERDISQEDWESLCMKAHSQTINT